MSLTRIEEASRWGSLILYEDGTRGSEDFGPRWTLQVQGDYSRLGNGSVSLYESGLLQVWHMIARVIAVPAVRQTIDLVVSYPPPPPAEDRSQLTDLERLAHDQHEEIKADLRGRRR